jgi:hypothetical protein
VALDARNPEAPTSGSGVDCSLLGGVNTPISSPGHSGKQQAITALRRDFIAEALRVVALKASHAADDVELGDDICAERGISIVVAHVKEAAATFREMQREAGQ